MTPDELRSLADEATPGPWRVYPPSRYGASAIDRIATVSNNVGFGDDLIAYGAFDVIRTDKAKGDFPSWHGQENARLISLAPDLARLCAELGEALEWVRNGYDLIEADQAHLDNAIETLALPALAKLSELEPK